MADELRSAIQTSRTRHCCRAVATWVFPLSDAVIMTVTDKSPPQRCDLIIVQADIIACDGAPRKAGQKHRWWIASIIFADPRYHLCTIINCGWFISPPLELIITMISTDVWKADPDKPCAATDSVAKGAIFQPPAACIAITICIRTVACKFNKNVLKLQ